VVKNCDVSQGRSMSFEITPVSRARVRSYSLSIVGLSICISCTVTAYLASNIGVTLNSGLEVVQGH